MPDDTTFKSHPSAAALASDRRTAHATQADVPPADLVREHLLEQLAPMLALRAELARGARVGVDVPAARARLLSGAVAYDPIEAVGSAGLLSVAFVRATMAVEKAGLATPREAVQARDLADQLLPLVAGWLGAEPAPRDRVRAAARRAAALVANGVLRATTAAVVEGHPVPRSARALCPCCGCAPDVTRYTGAGARLMTCARCDGEWETTRPGCLGCGATEPPSIAFVDTPLVGYRMILCNPCGRYLKEPLVPASADAGIERALTAQLDAAAEARGFRL